MHFKQLSGKLHRKPNLLFEDFSNCTKRLMRVLVNRIETEVALKHDRKSSLSQPQMEQKSSRQ